MPHMIKVKLLTFAEKDQKLQNEKKGSKNRFISNDLICRDKLLRVKDK
jgi:hypothetical protein